MDERIYELVRNNLEIAFSNFADLSNRQSKMQNMWEFENLPEFIHGYMIGDLSATAFVTSRMAKMSPLTNEEIERIHSMVEDYRFKIKELVEKIRGA